MNAHHRLLATVFIDQGRESLVDGRSNLLANLRLLSDGRDSQPAQAHPEQRHADPYQQKLCAFARAAAPKQFPETGLRAYPDSEDFQEQIFRLCVHEGLVPISEAATLHDGCSGGGGAERRPLFSSERINYYTRFPSLHETRRKMRRKESEMMRPGRGGTSPPMSLQSPTSFSGSTLDAPAATKSPRSGALASPLLADPLLANTVDLYDATGRPMAPAKMMTMSGVSVSPSSVRSPLRGTRSSDNSGFAAKSDDQAVDPKSGAPLTCPHCSLDGDVPPARLVRLVDGADNGSSGDFQRSSTTQGAKRRLQHYKLALTALSEEEYDARCWELLASLDCSSLVPAGEQQQQQQQQSPQTSGESGWMARRIAEHVECRVGAPPWHEFWARMERLAVELRERKAANSESAKLRLAQLQQEHVALQAQVGALSAGLLEVHPVEKARALEAEEQRTLYEASHYNETARLMEEQLRHLAELEARCLLHTGIAIEETRRAAAAVSDFASLASSEPPPPQQQQQSQHHRHHHHHQHSRHAQLGAYVDAVEVGQLLGDLLASAPSVAKDALHEAELLMNRKKATTTTQRFQCPDCLLLCSFSRYCPQTGRLHPSIPVPGAEPEDEHDFSTSLGAAKASMLLAQSGVYSVTGSAASDTSPLAKLLLAAAALEKQREKEAELERNFRVDDGKEQVPVSKPQPPDGEKRPSFRRGKKDENASPSPSRPPAPAPAAAGAGESGVFSGKMASFRRRRQDAKQIVEESEAQSIANGEQFLQQIENLHGAGDVGGAFGSAAATAAAAASSLSASPLNGSLSVSRDGHGFGSFAESSVAAASASGSPFGDTFNNTTALLSSTVGPHIPLHVRRALEASSSSPTSVSFAADNSRLGGGDSTIDASPSPMGLSSVAADSSMNGSVSLSRRSVGNQSLRRTQSSERLGGGSGTGSGPAAGAGGSSRAGSFLESAVLITDDAEAEAFLKEHVHEMLQCAVRRDIDAMRWCHRRLQRILLSADNKHIPRMFGEQLVELEKLFTEWFAAMVQRQRDDAKLAQIGASRMSYGKDAGNSASLRRTVLEDRVRKMRREVRELRYSIAKRPKARRSVAGELDDDSVFEALALRVRNLQRKKTGLRSKIRQAHDEHRAIENRVRFLRGELLSPAAGGPVAVAAAAASMMVAQDLTM